MSTTVAQMLVETLHTIGVRQIFGVVGDALNPFTEAVRKDKRIEWIGVRHEEGAALAAAEPASRSRPVRVTIADAEVRAVGGNYSRSGSSSIVRRSRPSAG